MEEHPFIPYKIEELSDQDRIEQSGDFFKKMNLRRSVRDYSDRSFPIEVIKNIIATAGTAPSGANKQPWTFCLVSNPELKSKIRESAEVEERKSYSGRMPEQWLKDLAPLGTDANKPFIEIAPYIIVVFKKPYDLDADGNKLNNYYVNESVGIAIGFLLAAIQNAGLVALTHTPSPMNFLQKVLQRPENERAFLLIPVGIASEDAMVPDIKRKDLEQIMVEYK